MLLSGTYLIDFRGIARNGTRFHILDLWSIFVDRISLSEALKYVKCLSSTWMPKEAKKKEFTSGCWSYRRMKSMRWNFYFSPYPFMFSRNYLLHTFYISLCNPFFALSGSKLVKNIGMIDKMWYVSRFYNNIIVILNSKFC